MRTPRRYSRQKVESVVPVDLGPTNGGIVLDLGEGGFACRVVSPMSGGQYFRVKFKLLDKGRVDASGQVAWVDETGKRGGLRFLDLPQPCSQTIRSWLNRDLPFVFEEQPEEAALEEQEQEADAEFEGTETQPVESFAEERADIAPVVETSAAGETASLIAAEKQDQGPAEVTSHAEEVPSAPAPPAPKGTQRVHEEYELLPAYRSILQAQQAAFEREQLERRRRLIFVGTFGVVALAASLGALFFLESDGAVGNVFADLRRLIAWEPSRRDVAPPSAPARPAKSTAGKARTRRGGESGVRRNKAAGEFSVPTSAPSGATAKPARPNVFQLEVVDSTNRRWTVTSRGGRVLASGNQPRRLSGLQVEQTNPGVTENAAMPPKATGTSTSTATGAQPTGASSTTPRELPRDSAIPIVPNLVVTQHRIERGSIVLQALIDRDGSVENIRVVSGPSVLAAAVMDLVRLWRYPPYYENGEPVEVEREIRIDFTISTK